MTPDLQAIVERLEGLERENRRLKRAGLAVLFLAAAGLLLGQARPSRTVETEKFVLKDVSGNTRAMLGLVEGNALLVLYGSQSDMKKGVLAEVGAGPTGPFLWLFDTQSVLRARLELGAGDPSHSFFDVDGKPRTEMGSGAKGA